MLRIFKFSQNFAEKLILHAVRSVNGGTGVSCKLEKMIQYLFLPTEFCDIGGGVGVKPIRGDEMAKIKIG